MDRHTLTRMITARFEWKIEKSHEEPDTVLLTNYKTGERLMANKDQLFGFFYEDWEYQYLPSKIEGKRVLDVGAGWGETIYFYRKHGYEVTAAIESDKTNLACLEANMINQKWTAQTIDRPLNLEDLKNLAPIYDFVKMDIEGSERQLLKLDTIPPIIFETHSRFVTSQLIEKFPALVIKAHNRNTWILSNVG